jgi:hypothetical protein
MTNQEMSLVLNTIKGDDYEVWVDERTGVLCRVSNLSGSLMGFASVAPGHPWFNRNDCPLTGISSYGTIHYPKVCQGTWWFYFSLRGNDEEAAKQKCRILAAQLEAEGSELAQQIAELAPTSSDSECIDGGYEDYEDYVTDDKIRQTTRMWANCNSLTTFPTFHKDSLPIYKIFEELNKIDDSEDECLDQIHEYIWS